MRSTGLWAAAAILLAATLAIVFIWLPSRQPKALKEGLRADGQIRMKDSRRIGEGHTAYTVSFIYLDDHRRNHDAECEVDAGTWASLKAGQDVKVRYLASDPGRAYLEAYPPVEGGSSGTGIKLLALTTLAAAAVCGYLAWTASRAQPHSPQSPQSPQSR